MFRRRRALVAATAIPVALLAAAWTLTTNAEPSTASADDERLTVVTSFYPLQFVAERVAGGLADVDNLTPPAADPHHLELSLARVRDVGAADVVVTLGGFMHAVDAAVETQQPALLVDAADIVDLLPASVTGGHSHADGECSHHSHSHDDAEHAHDDAAADEHSHGHTHDHAHDDADDADHDHSHDIAGYDPHFWLDPTRLAKLAQPVADAFATADPANAATFHANAAELEADLAELDAEIAEALAPFEGATLVTNHTAFGYLAARHGLEQIGITGLSHDIEPSPARLREIGDVVRAHGVETIFYETLVSPRVVQTLAGSLGIDATVLDTLEGLTEQNAAAGEDFMSIMRANLRTLTAGLVAP
ncbi:periplasmic solute binding protein [Xylanimonas cellulosilytica DSM 15894]|uniref:Periplasmic solute binding protein n=1 Tax=Xylanimonas cellulosilytica (strain DSM 15894 / JCM 12276 / CECT 5975 / KCTC 9989 / LMG 20990 / NBRC 107835 / XIL07) TaxID=446471 RepID=D1BT37_XYLCX|nr:zinc ABC transporter substrate-binding protein [Xylanimonas cellulosilytica]ACZ30879.1 periplasmic solute binding protein [Xylanimonas cellulosilytica DSM 15894]